MKKLLLTLVCIGASSCMVSAADTMRYSMGCNGYFMYEGLFTAEYTDQGYAIEISFEGDKVNIYNPFSAVPSLGSIEGTREHDKLTFHFPQELILDEETSERLGIQGPVYIQLMDEDPIFDSFNVSEDQTLTFAELYQDAHYAGPIYEFEFDEDKILGLCDADGDWLGYGNYMMWLTPMEDTPLELPQTAVVEPWSCVCMGDGKMVKMAFDGNDVYLGSLYPEVEGEGWIKGEIEGDKVKFRSEQYIGYNAENNHYAYFLAGAAEDYYDEDWEDWVTVIIVNEYLTLDYDAENKSMDAGEEFVIINGGTGDFYFLDSFMHPVFRYQDGFSVNRPANPEIFQFDAPSGGFPGGVVFSTPCVDADGYLLDSSRLYFRLFNSDKEVMVFDKDQYLYLPETMSVFPYDFMDDPSGYGDFTMYEGMHAVYLYGELPVVGVQTMLLNGNGEWLCSPVIYSDGTIDDPSAVKHIVDSAYPMADEWYSLQGERVAKPSTGLYILRRRMPDGSIHTSKTLLK